MSSQPHHHAMVDMPKGPPNSHHHLESMYQTLQDPTLVLLTFIWHTIYARDEDLENFTITIIC